MTTLHDFGGVLGRPLDIYVYITTSYNMTGVNCYSKVYLYTYVDNYDECKL